MAETNWAKLEAGLKKYLYLMENLHNVDVSTDKDFQRKFKGFYRIRRNDAFCDIYFSILEKNKTNLSLSFSEVLDTMMQVNNRLEASFASKLLASINPELPVWDKYVLEKMDKAGVEKLVTANRIETAVAKYQYILESHIARLSSSEGKTWITEFNTRFPDAKISDIKKVDLIMWQTR